MSFMTLDVILLRKKKSELLNICPFHFFVYLLLSLTNEGPHTALLVYITGESAIEYILRAKKWLDGFDSVFWQVSIEYLFVDFLLFFLAS